MNFHMVEMQLLKDQSLIKKYQTKIGIILCTVISEPDISYRTEKAHYFSKGLNFDPL